MLTGVSAKSDPNDNATTYVSQDEANLFEEDISGDLIP